MFFTCCSQACAAQKSGGVAGGAQCLYLQTQCSHVGFQQDSTRPIALKQACMADKDGGLRLGKRVAHHEFQSLVCFEAIHMLCFKTRVDKRGKQGETQCSCVGFFFFGLLRLPTIRSAKLFLNYPSCSHARNGNRLGSGSPGSRRWSSGGAGSSAAVEVDGHVGQWWQLPAALLCKRLSASHNMQLCKNWNLNHIASYLTCLCGLANCCHKWHIQISQSVLAGYLHSLGTESRCIGTK